MRSRQAFERTGPPQRGICTDSSVALSLPRLRLASGASDDSVHVPCRGGPARSSSTVASTAAAHGARQPRLSGITQAPAMTTPSHWPASRSHRHCTYWARQRRTLGSEKMTDTSGRHTGPSAIDQEGGAGKGIPYTTCRRGLAGFGWATGMIRAV